MIKIQRTCFARCGTHKATVLAPLHESRPYTVGVGILQSVVGQLIARSQQSPLSRATVHQLAHYRDRFAPHFEVAKTAKQTNTKPQCRHWGFARPRFHRTNLSCAYISSAPTPANSTASIRSGSFPSSSPYSEISSPLLIVTFWITRVIAFSLFARLCSV